jgi:hypothetical protein
MIDYIIHYIQPLIGLVIGVVIVCISAYMRWQVDKKAKGESDLPMSERPMSNDAFRVLTSIGLAFGLVTIILAIKFLTS